MKITINEIAKLANVSKTTVSRVLNHPDKVNDSTRNNVLNIIRKFNYYPSSFAQAVSNGKRSNIIVIIIPHNEAYIMSNPIYSEIFRGISSALLPSGYYMMTSFTDSISYIEELYFKYRVGGFIILSPTEDEFPLINKLISMGAPIISTTQCDTGERTEFFEDIPFVDIDNYDAAILAMQHLTSLGHRDIAFISTTATLLKQGKLTSIMRRYSAYVDVLKELDVRIDPRFVATSSGLSMEAGYEAMKSLLVYKKRPTAVFCCADIIAVGAMKAIREAKLAIPNDISIMGFDGIPLAQFVEPSLTTIKQEGFERGKKAAEMLVDYFEKAIKPTSVVFGGQLLIGSSTTYPKT